MLLPIRSCCSHIFHKETDLPNFSSSEKALLIFAAVIATGGFVAMAALFITGHRNAALFSLALATFSIGVWIVVADGYKYRHLASQTDFLSRPLPISKRIHVEEPKIETVAEDAKPFDDKQEVEFENFLEKQKKVESYLVDKTAFNEKDLQLIEKMPSILRYPEFSQFREKKKEPSLKKEELFTYFLQMKDEVDFPEIFESCLKSLSGEGDLEGKRLAIIFFLPYFFKFFENQKLKISPEALKEIIKESLEIEELYSEVSTLKKLSPWLAEKIIFLIEPTLQFLTEKSDEKKFLFDFAYQVIFAFVAYLVKEEIKSSASVFKNTLSQTDLTHFSQGAAKEFALATESITRVANYQRRCRKLYSHALNSFVLPHSTQMVAQKNFSKEMFENYFKKIIRYYNQSEAKSEKGLEIYFGQIKEKATPIVANSKDLGLLVDPVTGFTKEWKKRLLTILDDLKKQTEDLEESDDFKNNYVRFLDEFRGVATVTFDEISTYFADSPGEVFAKSYLLSQEIWESLLNRENGHELIQKWISCLVLPIMNAGIDTGALNEHSEILAQKALNRIEEFKKDGVDIIKILPIQDVFCLLFLGLFSVQKLPKLRPFIRRHLPAFFQLLDKLDIKIYNEHRNKIQKGITAFVVLLRPLNGALESKSFFKTALIKLALKPIFKLVGSQLKNPEEKKIMQAIKPLIEFAIFGIFGGSGKEQEAFDAFTKKLKEFYTHLYSFDLQSAIDDPTVVQKHLSTLPEIF